MPAPLGVASSLFLYSVIPSVPFVGYSIVVPTILSLQPVPDGCSPHIVIYLLASYALAYLFLLFTFSIALFPLPGFSCFHRLDVKLLSLSSLSVLHLLSLAHAVVFLLLPAYMPSVLSSLLSSSSSYSEYLPLPLPAACTSAPTFYASLVGVGAQSFFLLWLPCTAVVAWGAEQCWKGWTAEELQEIAEAQARHAVWRAEREEERRKLIDGPWYRPPNAVTPQRTEKQTATETSTPPPPPARLSVSSKLKEEEEEKEREEDEDEIVRYTQKVAAARRREKAREREEEKEQSEDMREDTEDEEDEDEEDEEEEEDDEQSEHSDTEEPLSSSSLSRSSSSTCASSTSSAAASEAEEEESGGSEEETEEREESASVEHDNSTGRRRKKEAEEERSEGGSEDERDAEEDRSVDAETEAASEQDEADEPPTEEASGRDGERSEVDDSGIAYGDQYGALAAHAPSARSAAAPSLPSKSATRNSAAPLPTPLQQGTVVEEQQPAVQTSTSQPPPRRFSQPMSRTTAVRQAADLFGATVPLAKAMPTPYPALSITTSAITPHVDELPPLPPMPAFAATAPITIPASSLLPSPPPPPRPSVSATPSSFPPHSATFSSHTPPLPIVAVPLRRPQLTPLSLQPPLPIASSMFGRTASASPPLPISPIPLSPKAFLSETSHSLSPSLPSPVVSPPPLTLTTPIVVQPSAGNALATSPPSAAVTAESEADTASSPLSSSPIPERAISVPVVPSPTASEPAEQRKQAFVLAHNTAKLQLVVELKDVQQQQRQSERLGEANQSQAHDSGEQQEGVARADSAAAAHPSQQHVDSPQQHPQRLSGTGQFEVETSDGSSSIAEHDSTAHVSAEQPAETADEISFSDDEEAADEALHADVAGQLTSVDDAAVVEHSVLVEEEVEEEMF